MVKLIRYANEGFKGYDYYADEKYSPKLVNYTDNEIEKHVSGCFVFVEEEDIDALISGVNRLKEVRHEILVSDETLIWTWNAWPTFEIDGKYGYDYCKKLDGLLSWQSWIKLPASVIADRVRLVKYRLGYVDYTWSQGILEC